VRIKGVKLENYKSFKEASVDIGDFAVIVGANASGKSNFLGALRFLRDASLYGFSDAISLQGGVEFLGNLYSEDPTTLEYEFDVDDSLTYFSRNTSFATSKNRNLRIVPTSLRYVVTIEHDKTNTQVSQAAIISYGFVEYVGKSSKIVGVSTLRITHNRNGITVKHGEVPSDIKDRFGVSPKKIEEYFSPYLGLSPEIRKKFFETREAVPIVDRSSYIINGADFSQLSFFDFDPRLAKQSSKFAGKKELEEDGSNFNVAMNYVLEEEKNKKRFVNLLADFLPFITNFNVDQSLDRSMLSVFSESEDGRNDFPSYAMSDGTMYLACLVLGVSFSTKPLMVIEEPEKYIHPSLAVKVIDYLKSASSQKQIIITSHSPQIVKYAGIENVMVVARKEKGSKLMRAMEIPHVEKYLENEVGLDQIFSDNLLSF